MKYRSALIVSTDYEEFEEKVDKFLDDLIEEELIDVKYQTTLVKQRQTNEVISYSALIIYKDMKYSEYK